ncbi:uncharacterized protein LOC122529885 [Frieseomelitta varia]|uniref:uncharacterized protein LOC122529885 n=1 Tax=Frieseomelitta varia TaxID=561572 RepID=UPI001CB69FCE|nr:uncharacterized protein LOC122529885 [Frieseomelitta varia]
MSSCRVVRKKCNKEKHEKKNVDSSSPSSLTPVAVANRLCKVDCDASVCGLFRLTWCIEPKLANLLSTTTQKNTYAQCANYPYCAAGTVQVYIAIFIQFLKDCNCNGNFKCYSFLRIR